MFIVQYVVEGNTNAEIPFQSEAAAELAALRLAKEGRRNVVIFEQGEIELDLDELRRIATDAGDEAWEADAFRVYTREADAFRVYTVEPIDYPFVAEAMRDEDAEHIAAFDPPTVLVLLDRIAELERLVQDAKVEALGLDAAFGSLQRRVKELEDRVRPLTLEERLDTASTGTVFLRSPTGELIDAIEPDPLHPFVPIEGKCGDSECEEDHP